MSYRGKAKRFYTNERKKHVPVTASKGKRKSPTQISTFQKGTAHLSVPKRMLKSDSTKSEKKTRAIINAVFSYAPIISELHVGYVLADSIFENLNSIKQLYSSYEKDGLVGVASTIVNQNIQNAVASMQTNIVWSVIHKSIPPPLQNLTKEILSEVMSNITTAEINFAREFIVKQKVKADNKWSTQPDRSDFSRGVSTSNKMPRSIDYV